MIDRAQFAKLFSAMTGLFVALLVVVVATGTVYAFPIAGVGGFYVNATSMDGHDMVLYPTMARTSNQSSYPQGVIELSSGNITGLEISKTMNLSDFTDVNAMGTIRLQITATKTDIDAPMLLRASSINASQANFSGLALQESNTNTLKSAPGPINMTAPNTVTGRSVSIAGKNPGIEMKDMAIQTHYLVNQDISLHGMKLQFMYDTDNDGTYEFKL
ncbi:MAG: hypothetical protein ABEJ31_13230 [Haloarculaceae archaeon]